jgi:hypothetical protein
MGGVDLEYVEAGCVGADGGIASFADEIAHLVV